MAKDYRYVATPTQGVVAIEVKAIKCMHCREEIELQDYGVCHRGYDVNSKSQYTCNECSDI